MNNLTLKHEDERGAIYKRDIAKSYMRGVQSAPWVLIMANGKKCSFKTLREAKLYLKEWGKPKAITAKLCPPVPAF